MVDLSTSTKLFRKRIREASAAAWAPPPKYLPSEWAEKNLRIPTGNAIPGHIRFANAPYQVEPLNEMANPLTRKVTLMWGAQTGKTQLVTCGIGYFIDQSPCSQMMMQPAQGDLQVWLETKFNPFVEANDSISEKMAVPRGREGVNNQNMKSYPGGWLMFAWSGAPRTMRGRSAPKIWCDEVDGYEPIAEGDQVELLSQRAATFGEERLVVVTSTPRIKGASLVESAFEDGDQRRYHIPCPHCNHFQTLKWSNVEWDKDADGHHLPETARYVCENCKGHISDSQKRVANSKGKWIAEKPFRGHASFHLNELYSNFRKWKDIVTSFLDKVKKGDLQSFVNVSLAETWEQEGEQVDHSPLYLRREHYPAEVPRGGLLLVMAVDVQDDRLEGEVVAYGAGMESWGVENFVLYGDPGRPHLWVQLEQRLMKTYTNEDGQKLSIVAAGIDSGGHYTQNVYDFCKKHEHRRVWALKGSNEKSKPIIAHVSDNNKAKVKLFTVGVDTVKELVMSRLKVENPGPGYCHFPMTYDEEFFLQLTAEKRVKKHRLGHVFYEWMKTRPRNEAFDLRVYSIAIVTILNPVFEAIAKSSDKTNNNDDSTVKDVPANSVEKSLERIRNSKKPVSKFSKGYMNSWRR